MSNRLGGKQGTAYLGTNANQPPNWTFNDSDPTQYNTQNVSLGDLWLNTSTETAWMLVSLERAVAGPGSVATWVKLESSGISTLDALTGNTGGIVNADINANINLVSGIPGFSFDGNPATHTITLNSSIGSDAVQTITGNDGLPISPLVGNIDIVGDNVGITITGNPGTHTLTASLIGGGDAAEDFPTDSGTASASGGVLNINAGNSTQLCGSSVLFSAPGPSNTVQLNISDANNNTAIGNGAGNAMLVANGALDNVILGVSSGLSITSGASNTVVGVAAGDNLTTGSFNILIGVNSGVGYVSSESNNILIGSDQEGTLGESNVLKIGLPTGSGNGSLNKSFIHGIVGVTPDTADGIPLFIGSAGQLGTVGTGGTTFVQTLTGNSGGAISPLAGNITIVGDGVTANVVGTPNTLTISAIGGGGGGASDFVTDSGTAIEAAAVININAGNSTQACGSSVLFTGSGNTIVFKVSDANSNTIIGSSAGNSTLSGTNNTVLGEASAAAFTTGSSNTIVGETAGSAITTGALNILIGSLAGSNYTSSESSNIILGNDGILAESHALHIGAGTGVGAGQLNKSFIHGIVGITPATADGVPVFIGSAGQLGTVGNGGAAFVSTLTGNSGANPVSPLAGNINIVGDGVTATVIASANTLTISAIGGGGGGASDFVTDNGTAIEAAAVINIVAGNVSQNCGSSVRFTGSGNTILLDVTDSNDNTIIGFDSGNATISGSSNTALGISCGSNLTTGFNNILLGIEAGTLITTGSGNFLCGNSSINAVLQGTPTSTGLYAFGASSGILFLHNWGGSASGNTFVGYGSGSSFNAGQQAASKNNTGCGRNTLQALTTGSLNTAIGNTAASLITTGSNNTLLGVAAGTSYTSSESNNICIGTNTIGVVSESNVLRIGSETGTGTGQLNKSFISGIRGITTSNANAIPVVIDSAGQLGTAGGISFINTLTANTGGAVSALAGNINVRGDGSTINIVGSPGTNTLTVSVLGGGFLTTATGNTGGAVPGSFGNINIIGDNTSIKVTGNPGLNTLTISEVDVSFSAYITNPVTVPGNVLNKIIYDTLSNNTGSAFNIGTSTFTAPVTGLYNFSCGVAYTTTLSSRGSIILTTSGNTYIIFIGNYGNMFQNPGTSGSIKLALGDNAYVQMTAGDTATLGTFVQTGIGQTYVLAGTSSTDNTGVANFFGGQLV